jgi:hypothetical protein
VAGYIAVDIAHASNVLGVRAVPTLFRAGFAAVVLFSICGFGLTRLWLPRTLRRHEALWVMPVGACAVAITMTVLGFAYVPYKAALATTIALGVLVGLYALSRDRGVPGGLRTAGWPGYVALLLICVALVPLFRAGFATVEGYGQDAHLAVGTAQFLQHHYPTAIDIREPVDRVPLVWRSKQPIYYALASVASLSGLEPYQTISTVAAVMLGLTLLGFFLLARELLGAPMWGAVAAMAAVGLDRMVLHTIMHPYFNQTWGFFAMPFAIVLAWWTAQERRTRGAFLLFGLFLTILTLAYPLAAPIPLIALVIFLWPERRTLWRQLYHGRRSLWWIVPLALVLIIPIGGAVEKVQSATQVVFNPTRSLGDWGGDLSGYYPEEQFFAMRSLAALILAAPLLIYAIARALRDRPLPVRRAFIVIFAFAAVFAFYFRLRTTGYYFHFKVLAFVAPIALTAAVVGFSRMRSRFGPVVVALLLLGAITPIKRELSNTYDELPKTVLALRTIDAALPPGQSIRIDVDPQQQNWIAYMLAGQPLCSQHPLLHTSYPHVPTSRKADWILTRTGAPSPADAIGGPVRRLEDFTLYRENPKVPGPANCSQRMVQTVTNVPIS